MQWIAFLGSLFSVWLYGKKGVYGPIAGMLTSIAFIILGITTNLYAAIVANVVFFVLHIKNLRKIMKEDWTRIKQKIINDVNALVTHTAEAEEAAGWWNGQDSNNPYVRATKLCLIHSEISEAMEADRKGLKDDKLPHRSGLEVELADAVIRICGLAGKLKLDLGGAIAEKMEYNHYRLDHKPENRAKPGGKIY